MTKAALLVIFTLMAMLAPAEAQRGPVCMLVNYNPYPEAALAPGYGWCRCTYSNGKQGWERCRLSDYLRR